LDVIISAGGKAAPLLEVRGLYTEFATPNGTVRAVDGVTFSVNHGEVLGLVGESGSGKSVTALSIARLLPFPSGRTVGGEIMFDGTDLLRLSERRMSALRGHRIGFVFQDPMASLNPLKPVGEQIAETTRRHLGLSRRAARARSVELLDRVGIPSARERVDNYPHQFSGGMRQRVVIAIAIACEPLLLLADEPTTALDVTIQAQILELLTTLAEEIGTAVLLITHDLGIAAGMCDRVAVMYAGQIVENAGIDEMFNQPRMPYTWGLLSSLPRRDVAPGSVLPTIDGTPPDLMSLPDGCRFAPRCEFARDVCRRLSPVLSLRQAQHFARCWGTEADGWIQ